jgi:hypothetical protein
VDRQQLETLEKTCFAAGLLSIGASIATWATTKKGGDPEACAHAERFGIFVGLWAPTFLILADSFGRQARETGAGGPLSFAPRSLTNVDEGIGSVTTARNERFIEA